VLVAVTLMGCNDDLAPADPGAPPQTDGDASGGEVPASPDPVVVAKSRAGLERTDGLADLRAGRFEEAAAHFTRGLELWPEAHDLHGLLAVTDVVAQRPMEGAARLRPVLEALEGDTKRLAVFDGALTGGFLGELEALLDAFGDEEEVDPLLVFTRGRVAAARGDNAAAARAFARVVELRPGDEVAVGNEARARWLAGDERGAADVLRAALERTPESRVLMQKLAWLLATAISDEAVDGAAAEALARRVLATDPENAEFVTLAAAAFAANGNFAAARTHEKLAIDLLEQLPEAEAPPRREDYLGAMRARLAKYQANERWREPRP
jgi:Flp pilus assembly protein TadD